jgi:hypothetical protein
MTVKVIDVLTIITYVLNARDPTASGHEPGRMESIEVLHLDFR